MHFLVLFIRDKNKRYQHKIKRGDLMKEYTDIKNNTFPIVHTIRVAEAEREEIAQEIIEKLCAIFEGEPKA